MMSARIYRICYAIFFNIPFHGKPFIKHPSRILQINRRHSFSSACSLKKKEFNWIFRVKTCWYREMHLRCKNDACPRIDSPASFSVASVQSRAGRKVRMESWNISKDHAKFQMLETKISSLQRLTSFLGVKLHPGRPIRRPLAAVTGHPDGVERVGLQALDQMGGWWDVHILLVDYLIRPCREGTSRLLDLKQPDNKALRCCSLYARFSRCRRWGIERFICLLWLEGKHGNRRLLPKSKLWKRKQKTSN